VGADKFGQMVEQAMRAKRDERGRPWGQGRLASELGVLPESGRVFDATGIRRIRLGQRQLDRELVICLISVLSPELDPVEAWLAAFPPPPWLEEDTYRRLLTEAQVRDVTRRMRSPDNDTRAA
jgi:hypothetical protein